MKKCILLLLIFSSGCYSLGRFPRIINEQRVVISRNNFKVIATAVQGIDEAFWFLGVFPLQFVSYSRAMKNLHRKILRYDTIKGKPVVLINIVRDFSYRYFVVGSFIRLTVTADVIEFIEEDK